jgi:hypothetical protein
VIFLTRVGWLAQESRLAISDTESQWKAKQCTASTLAKGEHMRKAYVRALKAQGSTNAFHNESCTLQHSKTVQLAPAVNLQRGKINEISGTSLISLNDAATESVWELHSFNRVANGSTPSLSEASREQARDLPYVPCAGDQISKESEKCAMGKKHNEELSFGTYTKVLLVLSPHLHLPLGPAAFKSARFNDKNFLIHLLAMHPWSLHSFG